MKEASCESKIVAELLGFHLCECRLKLYDDCLNKFAAKNAKEQLKDITEVVAELNQDKLVKGQGKQIEELCSVSRIPAELEGVEQNFNKKKLEENNQETKQWSSLFENKVETLITDIEKVQQSVINTRAKVEMNNERQRRQNIIVYNLSEDVGKLKEKELVSKERSNRKKIEKEISEMFRISKKAEDSSKPRPLLIKFESLETKNLVLDNSRRLKDKRKLQKSYPKP